MTDLRRLRERAPGERTLLVDGLIGGLVTVVFSFLPFSPVLGGAVAGYLHQEQGPRVGGLSGLFASVPVLVFLVLGLLLLGIGIVIPPGADAAVALLAFLGFVLLAALFVTAVTVVLGAMGGVLGVALHERQERRASEEGRPAPASAAGSKRS